MSTQHDYWRDPMPEEMAQRVLGAEQFDFAVKQGSGYCSCHASGAWQSNDAERFGAYKAAERTAIFRTLSHQGFKPEKTPSAVVIHERGIVFGSSGAREDTQSIFIKSHAEALDFISQRI
ncbi:hypothetical protein [Pseudomonas uvaldensis]|uniref:hypothetical protein n=1 Tax=Pseudomonas uvaldensis TaxID=2878385 RepID=UPI001E42ADB7|nr:hypothetical protein [Pseudomonas uvaldensis]MCE0464869.1 hypothetical protein [Pseudomonas uvaldensis]